MSRKQQQLSTFELSRTSTMTNRTTMQNDATVDAHVQVDRDMLPIAIQHGMELWWDGSTPTKRLDEREGSSKFTRFVNSRIEGKMAEVAFSKLLKNRFGVNSSVDWRIYGEYTTTDDGDLQHIIDDTGEQYDLGTDLEIKKTKPWNSWLAIRSEIYEKVPDDAPIVLTKLRIEDELKVDEWKDANEWDDVDTDGVFRDRLLEFADNNYPLDVEFVGAVYKPEFTDYFNKGDKLYRPGSGETMGPPLKRPNYGIHVDEMPDSPSRWNAVVADTCENAPEDIWDPIVTVDRPPEHRKS
jgi:hypothetical protein